MPREMHRKPKTSKEMLMWMKITNVIFREKCLIARTISLKPDNSVGGMWVECVMLQSVMYLFDNQRVEIWVEWVE